MLDQANRRYQASLVPVVALVALLFVPAVADAQNVRTSLCLFGCPEGAPATNHLIVRPIYALSYNTQNRVADWVSYRVTRGAIGIASRLSREPKLDEFGLDTLANEDFLEAEGDLVRSSWVPLVSFAGTPYWDDVNFLSNQVARSSKLNQGAWYGLEWAIRNLANRDEQIFVITGPIFHADGPALTLNTVTSHRVPDAFFKIVANARGEGSVFVFDQTAPVHLHHCEQLSTIDEVERLTGLVFFPEVADFMLQPLESKLGCF